MPDGTYAPQSPDLSFFAGSSPPKQKPPPKSMPSYTPQSPTLSSFAQTSQAPAPTSASPQRVSHHNSYQPPLHPQHQQFHPRYEPDYAQVQPSSASYLPPIPDLPSAHAFAAPQFVVQSQFAGQNYPSYQNSPQPQQGFKNEASSFEMPGQPARVKRERKSNGGDLDLAPAPEDRGLGPSQGIDIKTKFPVARIKRIMQADEEVGKVAQVTPVAVSKALELFMITLVTKSAAVARQGGSKRVTAAHLKRAIEADEQFDFLGDIVSKVVEGTEKKERVKDEGGDEDDGEGGGKKKKGGRKKKEN